MGYVLVVGEFCPLREHTAAQIRALAAGRGAAVVVTRGRLDLVPAEVRRAWVARACPGVAVAVVDADTIDAAAVRTTFGSSPVAVCGDAALAGNLQVDDLTGLVAPSGTGTDADVLADPVGAWPSLPPAVRGGLTRRICFVGAESTGKTTLSRALAERHDTTWVPEYGRDYTIEKIHEGTNDRWVTDDFVVIARRQGELEDELADDAGPLLLCDTDAFATAIWHERYLNEPAPAVEAIAAARRYDLYVLCGLDVPFEADGVRFSESIRPWMQQRFREGLDARPEPWIEISGPTEVRVAAVEAEIERLGLLTGPSMLARSRWEHGDGDGAGAGAGER